MNTSRQIEYRVTLARVTRAEWTKLRSLRSTWWLLGVVAAISIGIGGVVGWAYEQQIVDGEVIATPAETVGRTFIVLELLGLVIGVLGALQMSAEYRSGSIRASLAAVPRRLLLLGAKALAFTALTLPVMVAVCFVTYLTTVAFAPSAATTLSDPGVARAVFAAGTYPVGLGLLGLAFGTLIRHTAGAITAFVGLLLIAPAMMMALPNAVQDHLAPYQPVLAGQAMFILNAGNAEFEVLSPSVGALTLAGWVVVVLGAAAAVLHRRDA